MTDNRQLLAELETWGKQPPQCISIPYITGLLEKAAKEVRRLDARLSETKALLRKHADAWEILPERRTPAQAAEVALEEVERAGRVTRFLSELATMTDLEADFMDGNEVRRLCRLLAGDHVVTVPRIYSDADRDRAAMEIAYISTAQSGCFSLGEVVDEVAEALGMRRA